MHLHSDKAELDLGPARPAPARFAEAPGPTALVARCKAAPEAVVELQRSVGNAAVVQLLRDEDAAGGSFSGARGRRSRRRPTPRLIGPNRDGVRPRH